jgi:hypothetical protein
MYDFYAKPPKTKEDIRDYLTSWLQKPSPEPVPLLEHNGEYFMQELGFTRASHLHGVFRSLSTNEYVWWVFEEKDFRLFPSTRYPTYDALLNSVIDNYSTQWKLTE